MWRREYHDAGYCSHGGPGVRYSSYSLGRESRIETSFADWGCGKIPADGKEWAKRRVLEEA